jgi:hypothetical protein
MYELVEQDTVLEGELGLGDVLDLILNAYFRYLLQSLLYYAVCIAILKLLLEDLLLFDLLVHLVNNLGDFNIEVDWFIPLSKPLLHLFGYSFDFVREARILIQMNLIDKVK